MQYLFKIISASLLMLTAISTNAKNCTPSKHSVVPNITNKSYHQARKQLIANQWQPVRTININTAKDDLMYSGNGWGFWKKGYTEIETCSGSGYAPCIVNFKDVYGNTLKIYTEGEDLPKEKIYATVSGYEFSCK